MRRSISGPLIVMSIGVLFLLNNFYPDVFTFRSLFHYWPFLLIGLGTIRLIEVFVDAGRAKPLPPSQISAGGIILLVVACFLFWGVSKGARGTWRGSPFVHMDSMRMFGEQYDFDVKQSMPVAAEGEVVVKVEAVGICGSDMHAYHGHDSRRPAPLILGHEAAGRIVSGPRAGERVTINPLIVDPACPYAIEGRPHLSPTRQVLSMPPRPGAFAEFVRVPEVNVETIPDHLPIEHAARVNAPTRVPTIRLAFTAPPRGAEPSLADRRAAHRWDRA